MLPISDTSPDPGGNEEDNADGLDETDTAATDNSDDDNDSTTVADRDFAVNKLADDDDMLTTAALTDWRWVQIRRKRRTYGSGSAFIK